MSVAAKQAGGVDNFIKEFKRQGAMEGAPRSFASGVVATATLVFVVGAGWKQWQNKRRAQEVLSDQAEEQLRAAIAEQANRADPFPGMPEGPSDPT